MSLRGHRDGVTQPSTRWEAGGWPGSVRQRAAETGAQPPGQRAVSPLILTRTGTALSEPHQLFHIRALLLLREHLPSQVNSEGEKPLFPARTSPVVGCCSSGQQQPVEGELSPAPRWVQAQHVLTPEAPALQHRYVHLPAEPMVPPIREHPAPTSNQSTGESY